MISDELQPVSGSLQDVGTRLASASTATAAGRYADLLALGAQFDHIHSSLDGLAFSVAEFSIDVSVLVWVRENIRITL